MLLKKKQVKIQTPREGFVSQAQKFLLSNGFPNTPAFLKLYGAFIQHLPEHQDWYEPKRLAACMRKSMANEQAFYLMYPDKWEELQAKIKKAQDDTEAVQEPSKSVV